MYLEFLKAYRAWLDAGAPDEPALSFSRGAGLCSNFLRYAVRNAQGEGYEQLVLQMRKTLRDRLIQLHGDAEYPFTDMQGYSREANQRTAYLNPKRIAFVDAEIERLENLK